MGTKLGVVIEKAINGRLGQLNTLMLCRVVKIAPTVEIIGCFDMKHLDAERKARTIIQSPMILSGVVLKVDDIVLVGFLQEFTENGCTRKFDLTDAVIIGKVSM